jgi:hypothetical protein
MRTGINWLRVSSNTGLLGTNHLADIQTNYSIGLAAINFTGKESFAVEEYTSAKCHCALYEAALIHDDTTPPRSLSKVFFVVRFMTAPISCV